MKQILFILLLTVIFEGASFAQTDSSSIKRAKTFKNNLQTQPLLILPLTNVYLRYERALPAKFSVGVFGVFAYDYSMVFGEDQQYNLAPFVNYYLSKFKKEKHNRGFFLTTSLPFFLQGEKWKIG